MKIKTLLITAGLLLVGATQLIAQPNGPNYAWLRHLPDTDGAKAAAVDGWGYVYVAGIFSKTNTIGTNVLIPASTSTESVFLAKYSANGNVLWARHAGDTGRDEVGEPHVALAVDADGNAYLVSEFTRTNLVIGSFTLTNSYPGGADMYLAKFSRTGDVLWVHKSQGIGSEHGQAVAVDGQTNCYIAGEWTTSQNVAFDGIGPYVTNSTGGLFLVKYNSNGQVQWVRNGVSSDLDCNGLAADAAGNCFITGRIFNGTDFGYLTLPTPAVNFYLIKYAGNGVLQWAATNTTGGAEGQAVAAGPDGSLHVVGQFTTRIGFAPGVTNLTTDSGTSDVFVGKWNTNGAIQWAQKIYGTVPVANAAAVDSQGNCYVTGDFGGSTVFGTVTVDDVANHDFYVVKYSSSGVFQWVQVGGGSGPDEGWGVVVDPYGYVYADLTMRYAGTFGTNTLTGPTDNGNDLVLIKLDSGQIPPARLSILNTGTNPVAVSWSSLLTGWTLQQNTNSVSSVNWSNVTSGVQDDGTRATLLVNPPTGSRFYRLYKP
jgi:hypothetical protein